MGVVVLIVVNKATKVYWASECKLLRQAYSGLEYRSPKYLPFRTESREERIYEVILSMGYLVIDCGYCGLWYLAASLDNNFFYY